MKDKSELVKLISKYAMLLIILYAMQFLIQYIIRFFVQPLGVSNINRLWLAGITIGIVIIGNVVAMFFVMKDKQKYQIENRYLEILTLCFRPVGVCVLLIQMVLENKTEITENNEQ